MADAPDRRPRLTGSHSRFSIPDSQFLILNSSFSILNSQFSIWNYTSRRPSIALFIVTSSAYSMSLPTGTPIAMRVTRTPSGLSRRAR
jgi:hypothetical protein